MLGAVADGVVDPFAHHLQQGKVGCHLPVASCHREQCCAILGADRPPGDLKITSVVRIYVYAQLPTGQRHKPFLVAVFARIDECHHRAPVYQ